MFANHMRRKIAGGNSSLRLRNRARGIRANYNSNSSTTDKTNQSYPNMYSSAPYENHWGDADYSSYGMSQGYPNMMYPNTPYGNYWSNADYSGYGMGQSYPNMMYPSAPYGNHWNNADYSGYEMNQSYPNMIYPSVTPAQYGYGQYWNNSNYGGAVVKQESDNGFNKKTKKLKRSSPKVLRKFGNGLKKGIKTSGHILKSGAKWVAKGAAWQIGKEAVKGIFSLF